MAKINDIGVIVVDYQSDPLLNRALSAISRTSSDFSLKVVVIENSPRNSRPEIPENLGVQFFRQNKNMGFGRAVNFARKKLSTPYFFLVNPDVVVFPETLSILYEYMEKHSDIGLIAPKLLDSQGNLQMSARRFYDVSAILFRRTFLGKMFPNSPAIRNHLMTDWDHASIQEIDWALGACMLIRQEAVGEEIFDPRFFLYYEDVDLCLRLKKSGWKVVYHPEAKAIHEHRQASRKTFLSRANLEHFISWVKFVTKHKSISGIG